MAAQPQSGVSAPARRAAQRSRRRTLPVARTFPSPARKRWFTRKLLQWYARHGRDLPWRHTRDPYRVLVSEMMLQQTQVSRVIPKYREWMRKYPSWGVLAKAPVRQVRDTWYPLGYNIRPIRLREIARTVTRKYAGRLPDTKPELLALTGIGRYTAGALLTFAYGKREPILDTNVRRVLRRVFFGNRPVTDRVLWDLSAAVLPRRQPYDFNQALMDLGATVCTARAPACPGCPMRPSCRAYPLFSPA
ncbi:MAG: adenine glycosylase [Armatimonadetes bacterium 13_1_40CM_3_65_7]|nr:MAG: adenine glycosylase [Armatimonadetes bacterium 13_1_40CM_3_65_7]